MKLFVSLMACLLLSISALAATPILEIDGKAADDFFGYSVSVIGDVNHDGFNDIVVGAPQARENPLPPPADPADPATYITGYFRVVSGRDGATMAEQKLGVHGSRTGWSVAGLGDTDGDHTPDFLIGSPGINPGILSGAFLLLNLGQIARFIPSPLANDWFGYDLTSIGDMDGDGRDDFAVGAPATNLNDGAIYIYSGAQVAAGVTTPIQTLTVSGSFGLGADVASGGDVNQDGIPDLIAGSWNHHLYVFFGQSGSLNVTPQDVDLGVDVASVELVGDVDQDGFDDVVASSEVNSSVYLFLGGAVGVATTAIVLGPPSTLTLDQHYLGYSLTKARDLDCNGSTNDFMVGVPLSDAGKAHAFSFNSSGNTLSLVGSAADYVGTLADSQFGFAISAGWLGGPLSSTQVAIGAPMSGTGKVSVYRVECGVTNPTPTPTPSPSPTPGTGAVGNPGASGPHGSPAVIDSKTSSVGCSASAQSSGFDLAIVLVGLLPLIARAFGLRERRSSRA